MKLVFPVILALFFQFSGLAQNWQALNEKVLDLADKGEMDSAIHYANEALKAAGSEFGQKHPNYVRALNILALIHDLNNDFSKAEPLYWRAVNAQKEITGENHADYIAALEQMAIT